MLNIQSRGPSFGNLTPSGPMSKGFAGYALSQMAVGNYCFLPVPSSRLAELLAMRFHTAALRLGMTIRTKRGHSVEERPVYGLHVWRDA